MEELKILDRYTKTCGELRVKQGLTKKSDFEKLSKSLKNGEKPATNLFKKVYPWVYFGLEYAKEKIKTSSLYDLKNVRYYFYYIHNFEIWQSDELSEFQKLWDMVLPARIIGKNELYLVKVEVFDKSFRVKAEETYKIGEFVIIHRNLIAERIDPKTYKNLSAYLKKLISNQDISEYLDKKEVENFLKESNLKAIKILKQTISSSA